MTQHLPAPTADGDVEKNARPAGEEDMPIDGFTAEGASSSSTDEESRSRKDEDSEDGRSSRRDPENASIANRVMSRITTRSSVAPSPPPDGGFTAWMVVFSGHLVIMCTWGVINSFGAFQAYYTTTLGRSPSDISWIGSVEVFLLFFIGTFTGRLTDAGFFKPVMLVGVALVTLGIFTTAVCTQYWQLFLAQGVCLGLGNGFLFCPTMAVISTYWQKKRSLVMGIAACGSATGGLVFPSMVRQLLPKIGFAWTVRAIGFIQVGCLVIALVFLKTRVPPRKSGRLIDFAAFKELEYTFYATGAFMCFLGVYFPFFFLSSYARDIRGLSYSASLDLLLLLNGIGVIGRLLPNHMADRLGGVNMFIPMAACSALLMYCWASVSSAAGLYAWAVVYGISAGGIQSLFPAALSSLTTDLRKAGTRMGMVFTIVSFAVLIGPPIEGVLISSTGGSYLGAQMFAGTALALGMAFLVLAREVRRRKAGQAMWSKV